jgi:N-acetylmuramoyl-L-alanine amidase
MNFATLKKVCLLIVCYILIVGFQQTNAQLSGKKIGIDPGHGGSDPGAVGWDGPGYPDEKDFNLAVGLKYRTKLQNAGAIVEMTRTSDIYVSLVARVEKMNNFQPHHYVSIHCNSHSDPSANGTETYWHTLGYPTDQLLATKIQSRLVQFLGRRDRGVKQADFIVLTANSPAALAELLFISNQIEFNIINSESGQENAATGLYYGSFDFVNSSSPTLSVNPTSLSFGDVPVGTSSNPKSYTITGSNLTSNVVINAPSGFEISTSSGGPYGSSLTLSPSSGSISATVYVRFSPTSAQSYSGNITNTSSGITRNVSVSGTGVQPTPSPPVLVSPGTNSPPGQIFYNMPPSLFIWRSVPNVDMYGFYQEKRDTSGKWVLISQKNTPDTSLSFVYVQVVGAYDGEYRWYVNAHNSAGWGSFSAPLYYKVVTPASISVDLAYIDFGDVQVGSFLDKNITIRNSGSGTLSVRLSISGNSFSIISGGDTFNLSSGQTRVVGIRFSPASGGSYTGTLNITHNATNQPSPITIPLSGNGVELVTHGIPLLKGWNMISSFVLPIDIKLDSIFKNIKSNLVILKDGLGRSYWPFLGVDQIGNWSIYSGYQVYMKNPDTLKIVGHIIKPETTIYSLQKGWNLISYVRRTPMDIDSALSSIKSYINIVKDNDGRVYWPKYTVNQIGLMRPGQGYLINLTQECRFSYPANERVSTSINLNIIGSTDSSYKTSSEPVHFKFVRNTGNNATVGIPLSAQPSVNGVPLEVGDEIGAFTPAGLCVGAVVWEQKNTALTVWGDDEMTPEVDGIKPGEQISYRIWKRSTDREYQATATYSLGDGIYQPNAIFILSSLSARLTPVEISDVNLPNTFVLYQNYPNPFNPTTTIKYGIPVRAHVKLEIYNILGQKVETLIDAVQEPGFYFFDIDASRFSGGVYFYRLTAVSEKSVFSDYKKMIILK